MLCKIKGFCEWPALITGLEGSRINVQFFGDGTTYKSTIKNIYKFSESAYLIQTNLRGRKNPLFHKSVLEAERALGIPFELSITNRSISDI